MPVDGVTRGTAARTRRCAALFAAGVLLPLPLLAGCGSGGGADAAAPVAHDVAGAGRAELSGRGTVRWAVDERPATLNAFHHAADAGTDRVAGAVLPTLFTLDAQGRAHRNPDYLESAEITDREPRQVVVYRLNPKAVWSSGRAIGVADFRAQWRALRGKNAAYRTARNAGYERIERIAPGGEAGEIEVTFRRPYADWRALFTPLYSKEAMGSPRAFNTATRHELPVTAGPFMPKGASQPQQSERQSRRSTTGAAGRGADSPADQRAAAAADEDTGKAAEPRADGPAGRPADRGADDRGRRRGEPAPLSLVRNPRWWGETARLDELVLTPVPRAERAAALAAGSVDVAEVDAATADRIVRAGGADETAGSGDAKRPAGGAPPGGGPNWGAGPAALPGLGHRTLAGTAGALRSWVIEHGPQRARAAAVRAATAERAAAARRAAETRALGMFTVRRSLEPAYTQLALNGTAGPLADERVRRAVARAIDRKALAAAVLRPRGLAAEPLGSHLAVLGQHGYRDNSGALGGRDPEAARALLADAGWQPGDGQVERQPLDAKRDARADARDRRHDTEQRARHDAGQRARHDAEQGARQDTRHDAPREAREAGGAVAAAPSPGSASGAAGPAGRRDQPAGDRAPGSGPVRNGPDHRVGGTARGEQAGTRGLVPGGAPVRVKDGRPLVLRFVLPAGPGTEQARDVGERIVRMLAKIGVRTDVAQVPAADYFRHYVVGGDFDLALYSWPATAFPATDARPIFAKPRPAPDGSLLVEQNYTRVGTDQIDQLFERASTELDPDAARKLLQRADARIWAAAGSLPLYQRPQHIAVRSGLANVGAFGLRTPRYQDIGYERSEDAKADAR